MEDKLFLAACDKLMLDDIQTRREENPKVFIMKQILRVDIDFELKHVTNPYEMY